MGLLGNRQQPAAAEQPAPAETPDLQSELAAAQAELEEARQAQTELYGAAQASKANVAHLVEQVRTNKSLIIDGVDAYGSEAFSKAKATAEFDELRIEAGVGRLHAATMAERRVRAKILAAQVAAELPAHNNAINAAMEQAKQALDALLVARNAREQKIKVVSRQADDLRSDDDRSVIRWARIGLELSVGGTSVGQRDVAGEAQQYLQPVLADLFRPLLMSGRI